MSIENVNSIIKALNSGIEFYESAIENVDDPTIAGVFKTMIQVRKDALIKLQPFAKISDGEPETGNSWSVKVREAYTKIAATISSDKDHTYIEQLEEVEDKTLEEINSAIEQSTPTLPYVSVLGEVHLEMKQCHDRMLSLQKATS